MTKKMNKSVFILMGIYILFLVGYRSLPTVMIPKTYQTNYEMWEYETAMEDFRDSYMLVFAILVFLVCLRYQKGTEGVISGLFILPLIFDNLLLPLVGSIRMSAWTIPNFTVTSWGFAVIYSTLSERIDKKPVGLRRTILLSFGILFFQLFNIITVVLYSGPM